MTLCIKSFNGKLSDELLDHEVFDTLLEAKVLIVRGESGTTWSGPTAALMYRPLALEAIVPWTPALGACAHQPGTT